MIFSQYIYWIIALMMNVCSQYSCHYMWKHGMYTIVCMFLVDNCTCNFFVSVLYVCLCLPVYLYFYISAWWRINLFINTSSMMSAHIVDPVGLSTHTADLNWTELNSRNIHVVSPWRSSSTSSVPFCSVHFRSAVCVDIAGHITEECT